MPITSWHPICTGLFDMDFFSKIIFPNDLGDKIHFPFGLSQTINVISKAVRLKCV